MKRILLTLTLVLTALTGLKPSYLAAAELPKAPNTSEIEDISYVGGGFYLFNGISVNAATGVTPDVITLSVLLPGKKRLEGKYGNFIPHLIEIRLFMPYILYPKMPLLREAWDEDNDGIADHIGIPVYDDDGNLLNIRTYIISPEKRVPMAELGFFTFEAPDDI